MACNPWYEEARDGRFWLISDTLFGWVKQFKPEELAGDDADALGFLQAMLAPRAALRSRTKPFTMPCAVLTPPAATGMGGLRW